MAQYLCRIGLFAIALVTSVSVFATPVAAASPYLQVSSSDNVNFQITITGAASYSQVDFYTRQTDTQLWTSYNNLGQTDGSGYFTKNLAINSFNPGLRREAYVVVAGMQSAVVSVGATASVPASVSFSPPALTVAVGQNAFASIYGGVGGYTISSNSNPAVASASINNTNLSVYGLANGSTIMTVCGSYVYPTFVSNCGNITVTVTGTTGNLWFSPSSPTMYAGQSLAVSINSSAAYAVPVYNQQYYYISANSNPSAITASVSGTVLNLTANAQGTAAVTVVHSSLGWSATLTVNVVGATSSSGLWLSSSNLQLTTGQSLVATIYSDAGYAGSYYIASNSNPAVASASVNGSSFSVYGLAQGSSNISICQNNVSRCVTAYITVSGVGYPGPGLYPNGQLVNQNGTIYIVYKNMLLGFSNADAFLGLGFSFANASNIYTGLPMWSYTVSSQYATHPWGSWVRSGQTVYFVHQDGLIPVPSFDMFLSNGGQSHLVVPMNMYDWQRPMLGLMVYNDARLR